MAQLGGITHLYKSREDTTDHGVYEDHDQSQHHGKKFVLSKVKVLKEKAKKWKGILQKKKHNGHDGEPATPPSLDLSLIDEEVDDREDQFEDSPEFHGAPSNPLYESEMAPEIYRDSNITDFSPRKEKLKLQNPHQNINDQGPISWNGMSGVTQLVSGILAPVYNMILGVTTKMSSKIHVPIVSAREEVISKQKWDRGFSLKEFLLKKLEPGEEDRLLSQVITEAIGPKKKGTTSGTMDNDGVVEKNVMMDMDVKGSEGGPPIPISSMPHTRPCSSSPKDEPQTKKLLYSSSFNSIEKKLSLGNPRSLMASVGPKIYPRCNSMNSRSRMLYASHEGETEERRSGKKLKDYLK